MVKPHIDGLAAGDSNARERNCILSEVLVEVSELVILCDSPQSLWQFSSRHGVDTTKYRTLRRGANSIKRESDNSMASNVPSSGKDAPKDSSFFKKTKKA